MCTSVPGVIMPSDHAMHLLGRCLVFHVQRHVFTARPCCITLLPCTQTPAILLWSPTVRNFSRRSIGVSDGYVSKASVFVQSTMIASNCLPFCRLPMESCKPLSHVLAYSLPCAAIAVEQSGNHVEVTCFFADGYAVHAHAGHQMIR